MMISIRLIVLFILFGKSISFRPSTFAYTGRTSLLSTASSHHDEDIARLQKEFQSLKLKLVQDLDKKDTSTMKAADIAEMIIEKAADLAAFKRYKQEELVEEAEDEYEHAHGDVERAQELHQKAKMDANSAEKESVLIESLDDGKYEGQERLRDQSISHAAHQLERDAHDLEIDAQFHELEAEVKRDEASKVLHQLEQQEEDLHAALKEIQDFRKEQSMKKWRKDNEIARQQAILKSAQEQLRTYRTTITIFASNHWVGGGNVQQKEVKQKSAVTPKKKQQKSKQASATNAPKTKVKNETVQSLHPIRREGKRFNEKRVEKQNVNKEDATKTAGEKPKPDESYMMLEDVAQGILAQAIEVASDQRHKQEEKLTKAVAEFQQALGDLERAHEMHRIAARDAEEAAKQVTMIESMGDNYDNQERVRDLAVAHAAHKLEEDTHTLEVEAQFHELEAEIKFEEAAELLQKYQEHENELKEVLAEVQEFKKAKDMQQWSIDEEARKQSMTESVKKYLHQRSQEG